MFAYKKKITGTLKTASPEKAIKAFLGSGSTFEGRVVFAEKMRIDGLFTGEISSNDTLVIGETACLQAELEVSELILSGRIKGNIRARKRVEIRAPATVDGDIVAPSVSIEDGVVFNGKIEMRDWETGQEIVEQMVDLALAS